MIRKLITAMTAGEINKALDRVAAESSKLTDTMIAAGRGNEHPSEYLRKSDPLSLRLLENYDQHCKLRFEVELRYGPGAPPRLPRGFGPRHT